MLYYNQLFLITKLKNMYWAVHQTPRPQLLNLLNDNQLYQTN